MKGDTYREMFRGAQHDWGGQRETQCSSAPSGADLSNRIRQPRVPLRSTRGYNPWSLRGQRASVV